MKIHVGSQVQQTHGEGQRTYRLKRCGNNNKDEDNCPKTLNDKKCSGSIVKQSGDSNTRCITPWQPLHHKKIESNDSRMMAITSNMGETIFFQWTADYHDEEKTYIGINILWSEGGNMKRKIILNMGPFVVYSLCIHLCRIHGKMV